MYVVDYQSNVLQSAAHCPLLTVNKCIYNNKHPDLYQGYRMLYEIQSTTAQHYSNKPGLHNRLRAYICTNSFGIRYQPVSPANPHHPPTMTIQLLLCWFWQVNQVQHTAHRLSNNIGTFSQCSGCAYSYLRYVNLVYRT